MIKESEQVLPEYAAEKWKSSLLLDEDRILFLCNARNDHALVIWNFSDNSNEEIELPGLIKYQGMFQYWHVPMIYCRKLNMLVLIPNHVNHYRIYTYCFSDKSWDLITNGRDNNWYNYSKEGKPDFPVEILGPDASSFFSSLVIVQKSQQFLHSLHGSGEPKISHWEWPNGIFKTFLVGHLIISFQQDTDNDKWITSKCWTRTLADYELKMVDIASSENEMLPTMSKANDFHTAVASDCLYVVESDDKERFLIWYLEINPARWHLLASPEPPAFEVNKVEVIKSSNALTLCIIGDSNIQIMRII